MGRQPRLLSCQFCRVRKLRCNREFPCSNCTSRGVPCSAVNRPVSKQQPQQLPPPPPQPSQAPSHGELLDRLQRVEALLAARVQDYHSPSESSDASGVVIPAALTPPPHSQDNLPPQLQSLIKDVASIDRSCFGMKINKNWSLDDNIVVRTCPIRLFLQLSANSLNTHNVLPAPEWTSTTKHVWLPIWDDAQILIDKYLDDISTINNIVHGPSVRALAAEVYDSIQQGSVHLPIGSVMLLLSIFAIVTHLWTPNDDNKNLFTNYREAHAQTALWTRAAMEAIEGCRSKTDVSLECVQGLIILSTALLNLEGFTSRAISLLSRATAISRDLGLHRLDFAHNTASHNDTPLLTGVRAEIGRRIWWHLAATDWIMACCSGAQRGTYAINPLHMAVTKPGNLSDQDLTDKRLVPQSVDTPTPMSYSLQRLRLAEEIRALVDRAPLIGLDPYVIGYEHILDADNAIERFLQSTPHFFSLGANSHNKLPPTDLSLPHNLILQRYALTLFVYGQRCRLHLPFCVRGAVEPEYLNSRKVSLMSARIIIDIECELRRNNYTFNVARFKLGVVIYSYFMAVTILVLDLCQVSDEAERAAKLRELEAAWDILEEAQAQTTLISGGTDTLRQVMRTYNIVLKGDGVNNQETVAPNIPMNNLRLGDNYAANMDQYRGQRVSMPPNLGPQNGCMVSELETNGIDWDNLMWVLEAPFL